jgi:two-component system response regulator DegU
MTPHSIIIADDHPIFREGLCRVIEKDKAFQVVGQAENGKQALRLIETVRPAIAVLDMAMPELNGIGVAREVKKAKLPVTLVLLTMFKEEDIFSEALDQGIKGYVHKESAVTDVASCLRAVLTGEFFISPAISHLLVKRMQRTRDFTASYPTIEELTTAERRVLRLISEGKSSKEIGGELFISPKTVENHRLNIARKLNVHGPNALLKFAFEHKVRL